MVMATMTASVTMISNPAWMAWRPKNTGDQAALSASWAKNNDNTHRREGPVRVSQNNQRLTPIIA